MKLTARNIWKLDGPASAKQTEVSDDETRGLYLRIYASGARSWIFRYKLGGRRRVMRLGEVARATDDEAMREASGRLTLAEARTRAMLAGAQVRNSEDPAAEIQKARSERRAMPTVEAFAEEFVERYAKPRTVKWRATELTLARWVTPEIGRLKMSDVHRRDIAALVDKVRDQGFTRQPGAVLGIVRKLFRFAVERGVLETSPCIYLTERPPPTRREPMTPEQVRAWWKILDRAPDVTALSVARALRLLILTGQRPGEVAGLRVEELDLEATAANGGPCWHIPAERRKRRRPHFVALTAEAVKLIKAALPDQQGGYLFPRPGTFGDEAQPVRVDSGLTGGLIRAWEKIDLPRPTPHVARHTVATELAALGFDELEVGLVLGHQSGSITGRVYIHRRSIAQQRRTLEAWERRLLEILNPDAERAGNVIAMSEAVRA